MEVFLFKVVYYMHKFFLKTQSDEIEVLYEHLLLYKMWRRFG